MHGTPHRRYIPLLADVQQQSVGIQHDAVRGVRDDSSNLAGNLNLSQLNETGLVLDSY